MLSAYRYLEGGSPSGSTEYLDTINLASTQCPDTEIVLGGYSQGGQILHNAAEKLTAAVTAQIAAGESQHHDLCASLRESELFKADMKPA